MGRPPLRWGWCQAWLLEPCELCKSKRQLGRMGPLSICYSRRAEPAFPQVSKTASEARAAQTGAVAGELQRVEELWGRRQLARLHHGLGGSWGNMECCEFSEIFTWAAGCKDGLFTEVGEWEVSWGEDWDFILDVISEMLVRHASEKTRIHCKSPGTVWANDKKLEVISLYLLLKDVEINIQNQGLRNEVFRGLPRG